MLSTSPLLHPERGSVTLMASLFVMAFMALYLHGITKILEADKKLRDRKHAYLCFKYQIVSMKNYVERMGRLNQALRSSYWLQFYPKTAVFAKMVHKGSLVAQKLVHYQYVTSRIYNSYCHLKGSLIFVNAPPYRERASSLIQHWDGTSQVRRSRWKIFYWHKNIGLSASLGPLGTLGHRLEIVTREVW